MKKFMLLGICGAVLAACDNNSSTGMEKFCLDSAQKEGLTIDAKMKAHCKCVEKDMVKDFGSKETAVFAKYISTVEANPEEAQKIVKANPNVAFDNGLVTFLKVSMSCAAESGLMDE